MRKLKEVFIYNETYPLPEDAYKHYTGKVMACSKNPMCLNNVKSDVEGYIAKWGKSSGIKIEEDDESSFVILKENEDFDAKMITEPVKKLNLVKIGGVILILVMAILALKKKNIWFGLITLALVGLLFGKKIKTMFPDKSTEPETSKAPEPPASEPASAQTDKAPEPQPALTTL